MEHEGSRKLVSRARLSRVPRLQETFVPATGIRPSPSPSPSSSGVHQRGGTTASSSPSFRRQFPSTFRRKKRNYEANICSAEQESTKRNKAFGAWEKHTKRFGTKMLQKLGYEEGKGLGKELKGELEPISLPHQPTDIVGEEDKGKKYFGIGYKG